MRFDEEHRAGVLRGEEFVPLDVLREHGMRAASGFAAAGVGAGDTVALLLRNDFPLIEASFGAAALGASPVPVNWHGTSEEIGFVLDDSKAKVVVVHADLLPRLPDDLSPQVRLIGVDTPGPIADSYGVKELDQAVPRGVERWDRFIAANEPLDQRSSGVPKTMIYTSGTTGRPKGVRRLDAAPDDEAARSLKAELARVLGFTSGMRTVVTGPMYHTAPNGYGLGAVRKGGFVVLQERFDAVELLRLVELHAITHLHMVPTMFVRLLKLPPEVRERYETSSLRHVVHAAAPCPPHVKRAMIDWWGPIIHEYYGGTETGPVVACSSDEWLAHPGSVGRPLATAHVRVLDDAGQDLPVGDAGEIFVRVGGAGEFTYEGRPDDRAAIERDGYVTCGDVGYLDGDGYLYLCDRKRDMVITGGVNVYPAEIEACLLGLDGVRDCAVFGVPDEEFGESIAAAVELEPGAALDDRSVREHVRRHLAPFKAPKIVSFHAELPREDSGKVMKRLLRAPYWETAGRVI